MSRPLLSATAVVLRTLLERVWTGHLLYLELLAELVKIESELSWDVKRLSGNVSDRVALRLPAIALRALRHGLGQGPEGGPASVEWPRFERVEVSAALAAALLATTGPEEEVIEVRLGSAEIAARLLGRDRARREADRARGDAIKAVLLGGDVSAVRKALGEDETHRESGTLAMRRQLALTELLGALNAAAVPDDVLSAAIRPDERN